MFTDRMDIVHLGRTGKDRYEIFCPVVERTGIDRILIAGQ